MHSYINFLIQDIQNAFRPEDFFVKKKKMSLNDELENEIQEVDDFLNHSDAPAFKNYCGLRLEDFPPVEKLEEEDIILLVKTLVKMYESWNILVDFPENLPAEFGYRLALGLLERPMPIMQYGFFGMDFCTGNPEGCEFQSYCPCLKFWEEK